MTIIIRTLSASLLASLFALAGCTPVMLERSSADLAYASQDEKVCREIAVARAPYDPFNELSMPGNMVNAAGSANLGAPLLASKFPMIFPTKNTTTVAELTAECMEARGHYIARR
jgi:hypothetical protein